MAGIGQFTNPTQFLVHGFVQQGLGIGFQQLDHAFVHALAVGLAAVVQPRLPAFTAEQLGLPDFFLKRVKV